MSERGGLSLHVPAPGRRPGEAADFSSFALEPSVHRPEIDTLVAHRQADRPMRQVRQAGQSGADVVARDDGVVGEKPSGLGTASRHADLKKRRLGVGRSAIVAHREGALCRL